MLVMFLSSCISLKDRSELRRAARQISVPGYERATPLCFFCSELFFERARLLQLIELCGSL